MKTTLLILMAVALVGCGTIQPAKQLTKEDLVGTYERFDSIPNVGKFSMRWVFLENGVVQAYHGSILEGESKWKIVDKEVHVKAGDGVIVYRLELVVDENHTMGSPAHSYLTPFAGIDPDGKRISITEDRPRASQPAGRAIGGVLGSITGDNSKPATNPKLGVKQPPQENATYKKIK
jgi:hypothetical protein